MPENFSNKNAIESIEREIESLNNLLADMDRAKSAGIDLNVSFIKKYNEYKITRDKLTDLRDRIASMSESYAKSKDDEKINQVNEELAEKEAVLATLSGAGTTSYATKQKEKLEKEIAKLKQKKGKLEEAQMSRVTSKLFKEENKIEKSSKNEILEANADAYTEEMERQGERARTEAQDLYDERKYIKGTMKKGSAFISYAKGEALTAYCALLSAKNSFFEGASRAVSAPFRKIKQKIVDVIDSARSHSR